MPFDLQSARKEGSDTEIAKYLASKANFNLDAARKEGTDTEIAEYLAGKVNTDTPTPSPAPPIGDSTQQMKAKMAEEATIPSKGMEALRQGAINFIPDALNVAKQTVGAVVQPIETAKGLGSLAVGGLVKALPESMVSEEAKQKYGPVWDSLTDSLKADFGSQEGFLNAIATKPAQTLSTIYGVTGALKTLGTKAGFIPKPVKTSALAQVLPGQVSSMGKSPSTLPEKLYASSLKMSTSGKLSQAERAKRIQTGLEGGYIPNEKGLNRLLADIDDINKQISVKIMEGARTGQGVPVQNIIDKLQPLKERALNTFDPQPALDSINRMEAALKAHPKIVGGKIPVDIAQQMKVNTYRDLKKAYGEMKSIEIEAQKALARGAKEELAKIYPELNALNVRDAAYIGLEDSLSRAVKRIQNRDIIGLGQTTAAAAGGVIAGQPGAIAAIAAKLIDAPQIKARLALALNKARKGKMPPVSMKDLNSAALVSKFSQLYPPEEPVTSGPSSGFTWSEDKGLQPE